MSEHYFVVGVMIIVILIVFRGITGSWRCILGFHHTFINTPFDFIGNVGESSLRCNRCWKDIKNLGYIGND